MITFIERAWRGEEKLSKVFWLIGALYLLVGLLIAKDSWVVVHAIAEIPLRSLRGVIFILWGFLGVSLPFIVAIFWLVALCRSQHFSALLVKKVAVATALVVTLPLLLITPEYLGAISGHVNSIPHAFNDGFYKGLDRFGR